MLKLNDIVKIYSSGSEEVLALQGINLEFRKSEFVSILGQSGCGKTTLLNIIGGLDRYTSGDLIINGKSTKTFKDRDWDTYRNHSIGFVFQSYNLIPHQTVLANVELALTLSGVSKTERRQRALDALKKVGLEDQVNKKPSQMSGGQMQRVAIARALVNDPDILLADEPTGALDTRTSVQIMEILKEVSKDRLVIMVTHNPELAEKYSTRIVKLSDGLVIDDSNPYCSATEVSEASQEITDVAEKPEKKTRMSFWTAFSLSLNNLFTKKGRTIMTAFAGSIGIIGIALILALSNGIQLFIDQVQEDTLSTYPITVQKETQDISAMLSAMTSTSGKPENIDPGKIYVDDSLGNMMSAMTSTISNNLVDFKTYIEKHKDELDGLISDIQYTYDLDLQIYSYDGKTKLGLATLLDNMGESFKGMSSLIENTGGAGMDVMSQMIDNQEILDQQYEIVDGHWPESADEVVLVVGKDNQISKLTLYMLGVLDQSELDDLMSDLMQNGEYDNTPMEPYDVQFFLDMKFYVLNTFDFYQKRTDANGTYTDKDGNILPVWYDIRENLEYISDETKLQEYIKENGKELTISAIIRPRVDATVTSISGAIGYTKEFTDMLLENNTTSEVINQQKATPDINVLTGLPFERTVYTPDTINQLVDKIDDSTMESFYSYMTKFILENPKVSSRLDIKDKSGFSGYFMRLPEKNQYEIIARLLTMANEADPAGVQMLCYAISSMVQTVNVTPENLVMLLPSLRAVNPDIMYVIVAGVDATKESPEVAGLVDIIGEETMAPIYAQTSEMLKGMTVTEEIFFAILSRMSAEDEEFKTLESALYNFAPDIDATYDSILKRLGDAEKADPSSINFYAKDFESKGKIEDFIAAYNNSVEEKDKIQYTDIVGALMSSVSTIINVISYVLIAFVAISLVVSSIMIGIITNISVLERTKEIGILRSIGASKKDISRVFNAETFIIGLCAGILGIAVTLLLCLPTNAIIQGLTGFKNIKAVLPVAAGFILVGISMLLTIFAGLIPSRSAAKKDPVEALRSE